MARRGLQRETLEVGVALLGIEEGGRPHLLHIEFLDAQKVLLVVIVDVEVGGVELAVVEDDEYQVVGVELAQILSVLVVVEALHVVVEPHLAAAERRAAVALQADALHVELREQVAHRGAALDHDFAEVLVEEDTLELGVGLQVDLDDLGLAVGVGGEVGHTAAGLALREVILTVARDAGDVEALDVEGTVAAVAIDGVVDGAGVVLLEDGDMDDLAFALLGLRALRLAHEDLLANADDLVGAVLVEDDDIVDVGAVADELILLQPSADEAFLAVDIELLVGFHNLRGLDAVEAANLGEARVVLAVFVLNEAEPVGRHLDHVGQVAVDLSHLLLHAGDGLVGFVLVELGNALHLDFKQAQDVVLRHLAHELRVEGCQSLVDVFAQFIGTVGILEGLALVDAFLDEDTLQGGEMQRFHQLAATDEQLLAQQFPGVIHRAAQHLADGEEAGLAVVDDAAVGRDADLAVGAGIECVDGLVGADTGLQVDEDLHAGGRHVLDLADFDFPLLGSFQDAVDELAGLLRRPRRLAKGQLGNGQGLAVALLDLGAHAHHAAALPVVVFRDIDAAARGEVGVELEGFVVEVGDGGLTQLIEVVGQDLRR